MNKKAKKFDYVLAVIFVFLVIITIYPFLNVLAISFNDSTDTIKNVNFIIPRKFTLSNYKYVFKDGGIAMPAVISVARTIIGTIVGIVCTSMVAYTLSRRDFVLRKPFQLLFVVTMYVSGGMIPEYLLIIRTLKLGNNFMVYILPGDHTGGLRYFFELNTQATVVCKREVFSPKFKDERENGMMHTQNLDRSRFRFITKQTELLPGVFLFPSTPGAGRWNRCRCPK